MGARFPRERRLRDGRDYRRLSRASGRVSTSAFVCLHVAARQERNGAPVRERLGVTVSRRVGSAVVRNRVKRQLREWFRQRPHAPGTPLDLVVIARSRAGGMTRRELRRELSHLGREIDRRRDAR